MTIPRIVVLIQRFYPIIGGMERQCLAILSRFVSQGRDFTVWTHRPTPDSSPATRVAGITVRRFGQGTWSPTDMYAGWWAMLRTLYWERNSYDLIHVYGAGHLATIGLLVGRLAGKPVVVRPATYSDVTRYLAGGRSPEQTWLGCLIDFDPLHLKHHLFKRATAWVALTEEIRSELQALGFPPQRIHLIANGVDEEHYRPADADTRQRLRAALNLPASAVVFLFIGRFVTRKGLLDLLTAWEQLVETENGLYLLLVGSGKDQPDSIETEVLARTTHLSFLQHIGLVDDPVDLYRLADVLVLPSHREGLPNVLLEGMACGLAPVVTQIGGVADVIQSGYNGLAVPPQQQAALAMAMKTLIHQPALRASLAAAARETILTRYSLHQTIAAYDHLYLECIKTNS